MPVTLPQLTRREFLKRAALAGAGMDSSPSRPESHAGLFGKSRDKHTFAFFSDSHIAADAALKHSNVNMADNLAACVRELAAWPVNPATVIVNGDLAFASGQPGDYGMFGKLIEPVRALAPIHLSLGNHDERENFWQAFPRDVTKQGSRLHRQATVFASDRANWFLLDSLEVTDTAPGEFGTAQLDWLARELDCATGQTGDPGRPSQFAGSRRHDGLEGFGGVGGIIRAASAGEGVHLRAHAQLARGAARERRAARQSAADGLRLQGRPSERLGAGHARARRRGI